jgi:type IV secretory pathway VirB4 component
MSINQLFKNIPERNFVISLLNLYGIEDFNDNRYFTKENLETLDTVNGLNNMIDKLKEYYIPCKANTYLKNITIPRSIVILRQFLKCHNYTLFSKEKFIKGKKYIIYKIITVDKEIVTPKKKDKIIVSFD